MNASTACARIVAIAAICLGLLATTTARAGSESGKYAIAMVAVNADSWDAIRYNVRTGEAWRIMGDKWVKLGEPKAIPESAYEVRMVALAGDWGAIRFDLQSGRTWKAREGAWVEIDELAEE